VDGVCYVGVSLQVSRLLISCQGGRGACRKLFSFMAR
jgi:hypothetical protein